MAWLCLWTDILDCAKLAELDDSTFRGWVTLLACAKRYDANGSLPKLKDLAYWCRKPESTVKTWLLLLVDHELIDRDGEVFTIHDWEQWQPRLPGPKPTGHAKTHAQRQREYRDRQKVTRDGVTSRDTPLDPPEENKRQEYRRGQMTSREIISDVTDNVIVVTPDTPHRCNEFDINCEQCKKDACITQAGEKWGASNGEAVVNDLLRTFPPGIVMDAMDACWNRFQNELKPAYLRKCCEGKYRDHASKNGRT